MIKTSYGSSKQPIASEYKTIGDKLLPLLALVNSNAKATSDMTIPDCFEGCDALMKFLTLVPLKMMQPTVPGGFVDVPGDGL